MKKSTESREKKWTLLILASKRNWLNALCGAAQMYDGDVVFESCLPNVQRTIILRVDRKPLLITDSLPRRKLDRFCVDLKIDTVLRSIWYDLSMWKLSMCDLPWCTSDHRNNELRSELSCCQLQSLYKFHTYRCYSRKPTHWRQTGECFRLPPVWWGDHNGFGRIFWQQQPPGGRRKPAIPSWQFVKRMEKRLQ